MLTFKQIICLPSNQLAQLELILKQPDLDHDFDCPRTEEDISEHCFESSSSHVPEHIATQVKQLTPDEHLISSLFDVNRIRESNIDREFLFFNCLELIKLNSDILSSSSEESKRRDSTDSLDFIDDNEFKDNEREIVAEEEVVQQDAPLGDGEVIDEYIEDDYRKGLY